MIRQPARVLKQADVRKLLRHVKRQRHPIRNTVIVYLSYKAGLRACEIAGLDWSMILASNRRLARLITIAQSISKNGTARLIPVHDELRRALIMLHIEQGRPIAGPVIRSERGGYMTPRSIVNWFKKAYLELGLQGCSSHSGRRTFITLSARMLHRSTGSLSKRGV